MYVSSSNHSDTFKVSSINPGYVSITTENSNSIITMNDADAFKLEEMLRVNRMKREAESAA